MRLPCVTVRVRFQKKFVTVTAATLYKDEFSPAQISERIREIAFNAMAQSAVFEDIDSVDKPFLKVSKKQCKLCPERC
jgi:hypothetical protein